MEDLYKVLRTLGLDASGCHNRRDCHREQRGKRTTILSFKQSFSAGDPVTTVSVVTIHHYGWHDCHDCHSATSKSPIRHSRRNCGKAAAPYRDGDKPFHMHLLSSKPEDHLSDANRQDAQG